MALEFKNRLEPYAKGRRGNMEEWNTITRTLEGDNATVGFGVPVQRGTTDHTIQPLTSGKFLGVTEANLVLPRPGDQYVQYDSVAVCEYGVIGVEVTGAVTAGTAAKWDAAAKKWSATGATIPGTEFETSGTDTVVLLRLRRVIA